MRHDRTGKPIEAGGHDHVACSGRYNAKDHRSVGMAMPSSREEHMHPSGTPRLPETPAYLSNHAEVQLDNMELKLIAELALSLLGRSGPALGIIRRRLVSSRGRTQKVARIWIHNRNQRFRFAVSFLVNSMRRNPRTASRRTRQPVRLKLRGVRALTSQDLTNRSDPFGVCL
jgi:hypothetical protein